MGTKKLLQKSRQTVVSSDSNGLGNEKSSKNVNIPRETIKSIIRNVIICRTAENQPKCGIKDNIPSKAIRKSPDVRMT